MSKKKHVLEICAPDLIGKAATGETDCNGVLTNEVMASMGHVCSYCKGLGWFWKTDKTGAYVKTDCPICKGSGMLDAVITVAWKAHPKDKR